MFGALMAAASARIAETRQSIVRLVIGVTIAVAASIMLISALLSALFLAVAFYWGPVAGHLAVAGAALLIAVIALIYAFARPRRKPAPLPAVNAASLGSAAVDAATDIGAKAAGAAAAQAFDAARSAGERIRSIGEALSADIAGERKQPVARKTIINATLAAVLVGLLIGRKM
ncbi:hypothetical protein GCM10019059_03040 [Camelimonas fluminis]|uniref:Superfamily III holin-X n=1 Tax=Camelimonas fluminis TaxID=1576911 RepID=A0ABV7UCH0_9HYPH|nr:hypothetical protein [Camelimonas fluminis]GHE47705.1 hypothetical protein GCM10019059_03040 [Camelimonas fluminis]